MDGTEEAFFDNKSGVTNSSLPASILSKYHNIIFYHRVKEAHACGIIKVQWILGDNNLGYFI